MKHDADFSKKKLYTIIRTKTFSTKSHFTVRNVPCCKYLYICVRHSFASPNPASVPASIPFYVVCMAALQPYMLISQPFGCPTPGTTNIYTSTCHFSKEMFNVAMTVNKQS